MDDYRSRISGPLLDRIDLRVEEPVLTYAEIASAAAGEGTDGAYEMGKQA